MALRLAANWDHRDNFLKPGTGFTTSLNPFKENISLRATLLVDLGKGDDTLVAREDVGLVIAGKQAIDDDCNQTGQMLAALWGRPQATFASKVEVGATSATVTREVDAGLETIEIDLPAVITTDLRLNEPRYVTLPNIMKAKKKPLDVKPAQLGEAKVTVHKMALPPERAAGRILGDNSAAVPELVRLLQTEAKVL